MLTLQQLAQEYRPFHNHICVVHDCTLVRLLGVVDGGDDFYYKVVELGGKVTLCSAVGSCVSLKEGYPDAERYEQLDRVFGYNGAPATEEFEVCKHSQDTSEKRPPVTLEELDDLMSRSVAPRNEWRVGSIDTGGELVLHKHRNILDETPEVRIRYRKAEDAPAFVTLVMSQKQWDAHPGGEQQALQIASFLIDWLGSQVHDYSFLQIDNRSPHDFLSVKFESRAPISVVDTRKSIHSD